MSTQSLPTDWSFDSVVAWIQWVLGAGSNGMIGHVFEFAIAIILVGLLFKHIVGAILHAAGGGRHGHHAPDTYSD